MSDFWFPHEVRIQPLRAGGGMGPRLGTLGPRIPAETDDSQRLVRGANGVLAPSSARVTVALDTDAPLGSEVTIWPGRANERTAAVIATSYEDNGDGLPGQLVLSLQ